MFSFSLVLSDSEEKERVRRKEIQKVVHHNEKQKKNKVFVSDNG